MINVTIGESKTQSEKPFPKLMKSDYGFTVLFYKEKCGTLLDRGNCEMGSIEIGQYKETWKMEIFTDYNEPITLQNA